ncbi:hypothetical protein AAC387_Pa03g0219 [Persea americana]
MKNPTKVSFSFILLFSLSSLVGRSPAAIQNNSLHASNTSFQVGVVLDLGTPLGKMSKNCISMALEDFYTAHNNYITRLNLTWMDSNQDMVDAASMAQNLLKNLQVKAIIGPQASVQAQFVAAMGNKAHVPILSFSATSPFISTIQTPYFIRTALSDSSQVKAIAALIKAFEWREVVQICEDTPYGNGMIPFMTDALQDVEARVPYRSVISHLMDDDQIAEELYKLKTMQTRVFIVHLSPSLSSRLFFKANENIDAAVGDITIIANRSSFVDFTFPYTESGVTMVVLARENKSRAWIFLKPLHWDLWLMTGLAFMFTGFAVWLLEHRVNEEFRGPLHDQIGVILWFSFSTLVFAHRERLVNNGSRFVVIIWVFVVWILTTSYTASFTTLLTLRQLEPTINDIRDLIKNGDNVGCLKGSFVVDLLKHLKVDDSKLRQFQTAEEYGEALSSGTVGAIFDEIPYLRSFLAKKGNCAKYKMVGPIYKTRGFGFVFPMGSPLVPKHLLRPKFLVELVDKYHVPMLSFSASSPILSTIRTPYFIRTARSDSSQVNAIAAVIKAFKWREVVQIWEDTPYGNGVIRFLTDALQKVDTRVSYRSVISHLMTNDEIAQELYKLKKTQTRVFIVQLSPSLNSHLFLKANELGMMSEGYVWIVTDGLANLLDSMNSSVIQTMPGAAFIFTGVVVWALEHRVNDEFRGPLHNQAGVMLWFSFSTLVFAQRERLVSDWSSLSQPLRTSRILKNGDNVGYRQSSRPILSS